MPYLLMMEDGIPLDTLTIISMLTVTTDYGVFVIDFSELIIIQKDSQFAMFHLGKLIKRRNDKEIKMS